MNEATDNIAPALERAALNNLKQASHIAVACVAYANRDLFDDERFFLMGDALSKSNELLAIVVALAGEISMAINEYLHTSAEDGQEEATGEKRRNHNRTNP